MNVTGFLKLILSYLAIAMIEDHMQNNEKWCADKRMQYTFEIAASILCAGWIAYNGW